ncbi:hypothetical protein [Prosthecobacter sp.]|uniref:hypothetical protein n=1 Tax=Prosthecobacter sp. TaxID=1965333 RepID=UPI001D5D94A2|nr:hypothetical protein [Prosthecobacter sp.]MCB1277193.1 hypothetical protein [Prosthecobacter sp.]
MKAWIMVFCVGAFACDGAFAEARRIHVFVALADNEHQGIAKVPVKIGNGDDAEENLYWGNSEGFKAVFSHSKMWKLEKAEANPTPEILDRRSYRHVSKDCMLVAEAWRGKNIHQCLEAFFASLRDRKSDLTAFIGHNGLMDEPVSVAILDVSIKPTDAIILCCLSGSYFKPHLEALKARPVLTTEQLMYPGSFLLRDALEVWLRNGTRSEIRLAAAKAYATNQDISIKAATGVFTKLE